MLADGTQNTNTAESPDCSTQYMRPSMKHAILTIFIFLATIVCYGQKEHLEPSKDFSEYQGQLKNYYDSIFLLLSEGFSDKPYARYTSMPSFFSEYGFSVEQKNDQYLAVSNSLSENYWCAKKRKRVRVSTSTTEIDEVLYKTIGDLFQLLARQTKKPDSDMMGNDGTTYYFATVDTSRKLSIGETWSPNDNSLLGRLVKICDNLYLMGRGNDISQSEIQKKIKKLIADLEK